MKILKQSGWFPGLVLPLFLVLPGVATAADPLGPPPDIPGDASAALPAPLPGEPAAPVPPAVDAANPIAVPAPLSVSSTAAPLAPQSDLPLAYKGLRLGMTPVQLKAFVDGQPRLLASATESLNGVTRVTLREGGPARRTAKKARPADPGSFFTLGCGGAADDVHCYQFQTATVAFLNDKAVSFTLRNQWTMGEALEDPGLKGWLEFVQAAFTKKYGQPATVSLAPGQTDFEDIQDLWNAAPFVRWNSGTSKVLLELSRSGELCKATIEVQDNAGAAALLRKDLAGK